MDIKTSCKSGCHWCCYIPVWCRESEAKLAWEASNKRRVKRNLSTHTGKDFEPCPFLYKRKCTVYESRPAVCRGYNSTSRKACEQAHIKRQSNAPIPVEMTQFLHWKEEREKLPGPDRPLVDWLKEFARGC